MINETTVWPTWIKTFRNTILGSSWPLKAEIDRFKQCVRTLTLILLLLALVSSRGNVVCRPAVTTHTLNTHQSRHQCHYSGPCVWFMTVCLWESQTPIILYNVSYHMPHTLRGSTLISLLSQSLLSRTVQQDPLAGSNQEKTRRQEPVWSWQIEWKILLLWR